MRCAAIARKTTLSHLKERLTDTERRTLTIVIAPPKYSSGELNMDAPKY